MLWTSYYTCAIPVIFLLLLPTCGNGQELCRTALQKLPKTAYQQHGSALFIVPSYRIDCEGEISQWHFLTSSSNISQVYFAVWRQIKGSFYHYVGGNNPRKLSTQANEWNTWEVRPTQRVQVKSGDVIGYFYTHWDFPTEQSVIPISTDLQPLPGHETNLDVFVAMAGLFDIVQTHSSYVDLLSIGTFLKRYASIPIQATVSMPASSTSQDPMRTVRTPTTTTTTTMKSELLPINDRCWMLPAQFDNRFQPNHCHVEVLERKGDIPQFNEKMENNFANLESCMEACKAYIDDQVVPFVPP